MGFFKIFDKAKGFLNKAIHKTTGFGGKVLHGLEKGIGVVHKILDVADQAANALENVPVLNEAVGIARPLIKDGLNLTQGAQKGTQKLQQLNGKLRKVHIT